jgi:hypothetical protein
MACAYTFEPRSGLILFLHQYWYTFNIAGEVNATTLATGLGLHDEGLGLPLLPALVVGLQVLVVVGQAPSDREKLILSGELFAELHQAVAQVVLARKYGHS